MKLPGCVHAYLHKESSQKSPLDVEGVGFRSKRWLRDGQLEPPEDVHQFRSDGTSRLQCLATQEVVLAPLLWVEV